MTTNQMIELFAALRDDQPAGGDDMKTNGDIQRAQAEQQGIPLRTLDDVRTCLERDKKKPGNVDVRMARMMLRHGRLTDEARAYVAQQYPQDKKAPGA